MACWSDLPNELTTNILRIFALESATKLFDRDRVSILTVCHRFHAILEPLIYASVGIPNIPNTGETDAGQDVPYALLRRFTRAIISRPSLGILVKEIYVCCDGDLASPPSEVIAKAKWLNNVVGDEETESIIASSPSASRDDMSLLASAAVRKGLPNGLILNGGCPGLLILLLHLLPSLASFSAVCSNELLAVAFAAAGELHGGIPVGLRSTTSIDLKFVALGHGSNSILDLNAILPFMHLPSVTTFTCRGIAGSRLRMDSSFPPSTYGIEERGRSDSQVGAGVIISTTQGVPTRKPVFHTRPPCSPVTCLLLKDSVVSANDLGLILIFPRRLESFQYSLSSRAHEDPVFTSGYLYKGLLGHKDCLTELFVTCANWWSCEYEGQWVWGSLSAFTHLQRLKLPVTALIPLGEAPPPIIRPLRNPLDGILPPCLVAIELDIGTNAFCDSAREDVLMTTGLPYTLLSTSQCLPELRNFDLIGSRPDWYAESSNRMPFWSDADSWSAGHEITFTMSD